MRFENGYPIIQGATDAEDSSHLAGILALTDHPQAVDMRLYVDPDTSQYIRCPNSKYSVSRDQSIMIMCGLLKQGRNSLVRTDYINGKDILLPSVHGIETIAKTGKATWLQRQCLLAELKFDGDSIEEPFQNMAKAWAYGELKTWTEINPNWDVACYNYLAGGKNKWRGEFELFKYVIKKIEELIK